jgi:hypothetical protein
MLPEENTRENNDLEGELSFGKAIYLSSFSSKASCYGDGVLIVCDVILGRVKILNETVTSLDKEQAV